MNINHLRYFEEVCKQQNITKASEALHVSQPSVTAAIKELENKYGFQLFVRANNRISLTPKGQEFLKLSKKLLASYDRFIDEATNLNARKKTSLKVGIPAILGTFFLQKLVPAFEETHPDIELEFFQIPTLTGITWVGNSTLDLLLGVASDKAYPNCESKLIFKTDLVLAMSRNHRLSKETNITNEMLANESLVIISKGSYHYETIIEKFKETPVKIIAHSNQLSTIRYLVENNLACTIIYKEIFDDDENICCIPFETPMSANINVYWKKNCYINKSIKAFIQFTQELK